MTALSVTIGANVTDFHTKTALAQADVRALTSEVKSLTTQMVGASDAVQAELLPKLQTAAGDLAEARARAAELRREMQEVAPAAEHAGGAFISVRETTEGLNARLMETKELFSGVGELFLVGFGAEKIYEVAQKTGEWAEGLIRVRTETGLTLPVILALQTAAKEGNIEFDLFERGISKLGSATQQAIAGSKGQLAVFQALGINLEELRQHGDDAEYMLVRVAKALDVFADGVNKETLVTNLFGEKMRDLGPVLHQVANEGMEGLIEKSKKLGGQFSTEFVEDAAKAQGKLDEFKITSQNLGIELGDHLLPIVTSLEHAFLRLFTAGDTFHDETLVLLERQLAGAQERLTQLQTTGKRWWEGRYFESDADTIKNAADEVERLRHQIELMKAGPAKDEIEVTHQKLPAYKPEAPNVGDIEKELSDQKRLKTEQYEAAIETYQADAAQYANYSDERIAILQKEATLARATWGENSKQYQGIQREITAAERERSQHNVQLIVEDTQSFIQAQDQQLGAFIEHEQQLVAQKQLTIEDAAAQEVRLTREIYNQELKRLNLAILMAGDDLALAQKLTNQKIALQERESTQIERIADKAATDRQRKELQTDKAIAKSGAQLATGLITGKMTVAQVGNQLLEKGLENVIEFGLLEVARMIGFEGMKTAAANAGILGRIALAALGETETTATLSVTASSEVISAAAVAGANAFAATAAIPYVGPFLAPAAGAAAEATVLGTYLPQAALATGTPYVPQDMDARIHKGEIVVPESFSDAIRSGSLTLGRGGRGGGGDRGGGDTHHHYNVDMSGSTFGSGLRPSDLKDHVAAAIKQAKRESAFA